MIWYRTCPLALSCVLLGFAANPAVAAPQDQSRVSLQADVGLNTILPYVEVKAGYRLPQDELSEVFLGFSPVGTALNSQYVMLGEVGIKRHWSSQGDVLPFWTASIGEWVSGGAPSQTYDTPAVMAGIGVDWNIFTANVTLGFPTGIRPEVGLKFAL